MARFRALWLFRSKPIRRPIGEPTLRLADDEHWLKQAKPAFPFPLGQSATCHICGPASRGAVQLLKHKRRAGRKRISPSAKSYVFGCVESEYLPVELFSRM